MNAQSWESRRHQCTVPEKQAASMRSFGKAGSMSAQFREKQAA
jgi:hypothetical protein